MVVAVIDQYPGSVKDEANFLSITNEATSFVKEHMRAFDASHDFEHVLRVVALAEHILQLEKSTAKQNCGRDYSQPIVSLAALLHDIDDHKYRAISHSDQNRSFVESKLLEFGASEWLAHAVDVVVAHVSYSTEVGKDGEAKVRNCLSEYPELAIVQDADRLDAIGAIGIGRCFTYGGAKQPDRKLMGSIQHFEDKLVKLKRMMKTTTGRAMAVERTERLVLFRQWWMDEQNIPERSRVAVVREASGSEPA